MLARDCELFLVRDKLHLGTNIRLAEMRQATVYEGVVRCGQSTGTEAAIRNESFPASSYSSLCEHCLTQQFGRAQEKTYVGDKYAHRRRKR